MTVQNTIASYRPLLSGLLVVLALVFSSPTRAERKPDIVEILGQFIQASHAASQCMEPDDETLDRFLTNFRIIWFKAAEMLEARYPDLSEPEIIAKVEKAREAVEEKIDQVIAQNGCEDPRIQDLLERFRLQADLEL